jgi:exodeoxyribonuclease VII small subunit
MKKGNNTADNTKSNHLSFEEALLNLETIVKSLEKGDLALEESIAQFSEGVVLSQLCLAKLNVAEQHIDKILQEEQGKLIERPLEV